MTDPDLAYRATTEQACAWLARQTATSWALPQLIAHGLTPYVWLDYDPNHAELFGDANGGYAAPIFFEGDTRWLIEGSDDVLITITKDAYKIVARLPPPGLRRQLHELRFLKKDLERLPARLKRDQQAQAPQPKMASESQTGISREQVLTAFASLVKIDLDQALTNAGGIFGDEGGRLKRSASKGKNHAMWNPVTLALGLNGVYRVPLQHLRRAFQSHDFLHAWQAHWHASLTLLGK